MNSLTLLLFLSSGLVSQVVAQATTTATCITDLWTQNQEDASPCLVAASLQGACNGGKFSIPALTPGRLYDGPLAGFSTVCACSTVTYSMIAACGACQGQSIDTWTDWITNCTQKQISVSSFPLSIPPGTSVPSWAYLDVTVSGVWDSTASNNNHNLGAPDSSASGPSPTSSPVFGGGSSHGSSHTPVAAIAGGVAGGVVALLLLGSLIFFLVRHNKNKRHNAPSAKYGPGGLEGVEKFGAASAYPSSPVAGPAPTPYYVNMNQAPPVPQPYDVQGEPQRLYDPADPTTFPGMKTPTPSLPSYNSPSSTTTPYAGPTQSPYGGQPPSAPHGGQQPSAPYSGPSSYLPEPSSPTRPYSQQTFGGYSQAPNVVPQQYGMPQGHGGPTGQGFSGTPEV